MRDISLKLFEYRRFSRCGLKIFYLKRGWSLFSVEHKQFSALIKFPPLDPPMIQILYGDSLKKGKKVCSKGLDHITKMVPTP